MLKKTLIVLMLVVAPLSIAVPVSAVDVFERGVCSNGRTGDSAVCKDKSAQGNPIYGESGIVTVVIRLLTIGVGIIAVITILLSGMQFITSGDNPENRKKARERIVYAAIALVIAGIAQFIVQFVITKVS